MLSFLNAMLAVAIMLGISMGIGMFVTRWGLLVSLYARASRPSRVEGGCIGWVLAWLRGINMWLYVQTLAEGLYMETPAPLRFFHKGILIPWDKFSSHYRSKTIFGTPKLELRIEGYPGTILIKGQAALAVLAHLPPNWQPAW